MIRSINSRYIDNGVVLLLVTLLGCGKDAGPPTVKLSGTVTIAGSQLPEDAEGHIRFMTTTPGQAQPTSAEIVKGEYAADNVPIGNVKVLFNITRLTGRMVREDNAPGATPYPEREDLVPQQHRAGIDLNVEGDNDAQDFDL